MHLFWEVSVQGNCSTLLVLHPFTCSFLDGKPFYSASSWGCFIHVWPDSWRCTSFGVLKRRDNDQVRKMCILADWDWFGPLDGRGNGDEGYFLKLMLREFWGHTHGEASLMLLSMIMVSSACWTVYLLRTATCFIVDPMARRSQRRKVGIDTASIMLSIGCLISTQS